MKSARRFHSGPFLLILSSLVALLIAEATLRFFSPSGHYVWPPNLEIVFRPSPGVMPGVSGESRFVTNDSGIRGRACSETDRYRILTIGGSTTECLYLDQAEAWPHLLQEMLNERLRGSPVWIGNVGKSGRNTRHHALQVEKLLDEHAPIDLVILLIGANDMQMRLARDAEYRPLRDEGPGYGAKLLDEAFALHPGWGANRPFYRSTEIWRRLRRVRQRFRELRKELPNQDEAGSVYVEWRHHRQNAVRIRDTLPDLSAALREYTQNVNRIIDLVERRNTRIVIMTQPTMWKRELPKALADLLWTGGIGPYQKEGGREYYSVGALADAMVMYNAALLQVCAERAIRCVDLAAALPKDDTVFYDDFHFNESGARKVAEILAQHLVETNGLALSYPSQISALPGYVSASASLQSSAPLYRTPDPPCPTGATKGQARLILAGGC